MPSAVRPAGHVRRDGIARRRTVGWRGREPIAGRDRGRWHGRPCPGVPVPDDLRHCRPRGRAPHDDGDARTRRMTACAAT